MPAPPRIGSPAILSAQAARIKIGHLVPLTGFLGAIGSYAQLGVKMAAEEINASGGIMGKQIDLMSEDSVNPATASTKAQRMIEQDGAVLLLGEISSASMQFGFLLEQVVNGLVLGGYYLLIALGLSLIFSVGGIVNLAHGAFYALGAYISVEITKFFGFGPAMVLSPIAVGLLGILFERFILRRFYDADPILSLLVTFGLAMVTEQAIRILWGAPPISAAIPQGLRGSVFLGDFLFSRYRLLILAVVAAVLVGVWLLLHKTSFGRVVRAGIQRPDMVAALGIRLQPYMTAIVMLGVGMAALGGAFFAPITIAHPAMGAEIITVAFVVVVIGGLGSFWGVVLAAMLVGVVRGITIHFAPAAGEASIYVLMFLVLMVRPRGLLGERIEKFE